LFSIKLRSLTKLLIFASLISLFLFVLYWTWGSYENFFGWLLNLNQNTVRYVNNYGYIFWVGHIGLTLRLVGVFIGLLSFILIWYANKHSFRIQRLISVALLLEGFYFLLYFPFVERMWGPNTYFLSVAYFLQILLTTPFLLILAKKVRNYQSESDKNNFWKWVSLAFLGYISALWINALFRWFDMARLEGVKLLFTGNIAFGFLNGAIFMTLALLFSIIAARSISKRDVVSSKKWIGLTLTMVGLHFVLYTIYSQIVQQMNYILLVDVWTIPFLLLGFSLLYENVK
jgi:hypothetical protein